METISERLREMFGFRAGGYKKEYGLKPNEVAATVYSDRTAIDELVDALKVTARMYNRATGLPMPSQAYRALAKAERKQP